MTEIQEPAYYIRKEMSKHDLKAVQVAEKMGIKKQNFNKLLNGATITFNIALKLERAFPNREAKYWIDLQMNYELFTIKRN